MSALAVFLAAAALTGPPLPTVQSSVGDGQQVSGTAHWVVTPSEPVTRVEFVVDGWVRHVDQQAPYTFDWDTTEETDSTHALDVWAVTSDGRVATQHAAVTVSNPFALAFRSIGPDQHVSGTEPWGAETSGLHANWVEFLVDGRLRGLAEAPPFRIQWDTTQETNGEHTVTLWAVATNGRVAQVSTTVLVRNAQTQSTAAVEALVAHYRTEAFHWADLMRAPHPSVPGTLAAWRRVAADQRQRVLHPPHLRQFLCIHHFEGAWNANTGNGYYGGLQMNLDFIRGYGPELYAAKGLAHRWTPLEQIWVAERAVPARGFHPWPQTAHMCGYI